MGKKQLNTPKSKIRAAIRQLWLRSRERAAALKKTGYRCTDCGIKQSVAKGRKVSLQVHHEPMIDWSGILQLIRDKILDVPQVPLCKECHKLRHERMKDEESHESLS